MGGTDGQGIGGGLYLAAGSTTTLSQTVVAANFASTSNDDIYGTYTSELNEPARRGAREAGDVEAPGPGDQGPAIHVEDPPARRGSPYGTLWG